MDAAPQSPPSSGAAPQSPLSSSAPATTATAIAAPPSPSSSGTTAQLPQEAPPERRLSARTILLCTVVVACVAMLAMMYLKGSQILPVIHQVLYPLSDRAPVGSCVWVDKESIARGYTEQTYAAQRNATRLKHTDLRDSMLYYLQTSSKLGGAICASMLQVRPLCYCIIDLAHQDSTEHLYTEMFNMVITANSTHEMVSSHETLSFCGAAVELLRYSAVGFRYTTPSGTIMDRVTDGLPSILVQQMRDVMRNVFKCPPLVPRLPGPG